MGRISCENGKSQTTSSLGIVFYLNIFISMRRIVCALALLVFGFAAALDVEPIQLSASEWRKGNVASNKIACFQVRRTCWKFGIWTCFRSSPVCWLLIVTRSLQIAIKHDPAKVLDLEKKFWEVTDPTRKQIAALLNYFFVRSLLCWGRVASVGVCYV